MGRKLADHALISPRFAFVGRSRFRVAPPRVSDPGPIAPPDPPDPGTRTLITTVALDSTSPDSQSNVIAEFGLSLKAGEVADGERIAVYSGETRLTVQQDAEADDFDELRMVTIAALINDAPLTGNETARVLSIFKETGAKATGAAKTIAQLLALNTEVQCAYDINVLGTHYFADFRAAAAASTTWGGKGSALVTPGWIQDGALRKSFNCKAPFKTAGGTAHSQLYLEFFAEFYSLDNWASIAGVNFNPVVCNGFLDTTAQTAAFMEATITVGVTSPVTVKQLLNRTIAMSFTKTASSASNPTVLDLLTPATPTPGLWNINDHGRALRTTDGKYGRITSVSADGSLASTVGINAPTPYNTFATGAAGIPSGSTLWGITLDVGQSWWEQDIWYGQQYKCQVRPERDYLFATGVVLNMAIPSSFIKNSSGSIQNKALSNAGTDFLNAQGNHPMRFRGSYIGEQYVSSNEPDARTVPDYQVQALRRLDVLNKYIDPTSLRRVLETPAIYLNHQPWLYIDDTTGLLIDPASESRKWFVDNDIPTPTNGRMYPYQEASDNHSEDQYLLPYVLTGKYRWLRAIHENAMRTFMVKGDLSHTLAGNSRNDGLDRFVLYAGAFRGMVWSTRIIQHAAWATPNDQPKGQTGISKANLLAWLASNGLQAKNRYVDDGSGHNAWSKEANHGPDFLGIGNPLFLPDSFGASQTATTLAFYWYYGTMYYPHMDEMGMVDDNWRTFWEALEGCVVESLIDDAITDVEETFGLYHVQGFNTNNTVAEFPLTWELLYPYLVAATTNWGGLVGYKGYIWESLVHALDKGYYDPERVRAALDRIIPSLDAHDVGSASGGPDNLVFTPLINSIPVILGRWVKARDA